MLGFSVENKEKKINRDDQNNLAITEKLNDSVNEGETIKRIKRMRRNREKEKNSDL